MVKENAAMQPREWRKRTPRNVSLCGTDAVSMVTTETSPNTVPSPLHLTDDWLI